MAKTEDLLVRSSQSVTALKRSDRYAHRLRAIGQLNEAEAESRQRPGLHAAIREARTAYQTDGTIPNWETLAGPPRPSVRSPLDTPSGLTTCPGQV